MTLHLYQLGEIVALAGHAGLNTTPSARYKVAGRLPALGTDLQYRVKGDHERFERVVREDQIIAIPQPPGAPRRAGSIW
jgi:hypothetical protein